MSEEIITMTLQEDSSLEMSSEEYIKGDKGDSATVEIGNVTTLEPGKKATVTNGGTKYAAILNFGLPKGDTGRTATVAVGTVESGDESTTPQITNSGTSNDAILNFVIPKGDTGRTGTIKIGTVTTGTPGSAVVITNRGTDTDAILDISIPAGIQGVKGDTGEDFSISKTYPSIAAMNADKNNVPEGDFVIIASNTEDEDNSKLYVKAETEFKFLTDLSGAQGFKGETGNAATIAIGETTTVAPSSVAGVTNSGDEHNAILNFSIPKGEKGDGATVKVGTVETTQDGIAQVNNVGTDLNAVLNFKIPQGNAASIAVGSVTTGEEGSSASITNRGDSGDAVFDFVIPKGDTGRPFVILGTYSTLAELRTAHSTGETGDAYNVDGKIYTWSYDSTDWEYRGEFRGPKGDAGDNATIKIGTVTTGTTSTVSNSGTDTNAVLNFVLEKGDKGDAFTYEDFTQEQIDEIISGVIGRADYATKDFVVARRIVVERTISIDDESWNETTYTALNTEFPAAKYDIEVALSDSANDEQKMAWYQAEFLGNATDNQLKATGSKPTKAIPVLITVYNKQIV